MASKFIRGAIAKLKNQGLTNAAIARALGIYPDTVVRNLKREDVREMIERESLQFIGINLPQALDNITDIVFSKGKAIHDKRLRYEASRDVAQSTGILSGKDPSVTIQQLTQQTIIISPMIQSMIDNHLKSLKNFIPNPTGEGSRMDAEPVGIKSIPTPHSESGKDFEVVDE